MSLHLADMPIPSDLQFDAGTPPSQWIKFGQSVGMKTRILSLWEMTEELIHNEKILSKDPDRFLAMIHDHKVSLYKHLLNRH